jgi:hypothetical protein
MAPGWIYGGFYPQLITALRILTYDTEISRKFSAMMR